MISSWEMSPSDTFNYEAYIVGTNIKPLGYGSDGYTFRQHSNLNNFGGCEFGHAMFFSTHRFPQTGSPRMFCILSLGYPLKIAWNIICLTAIEMIDLCARRPWTDKSLGDEGMNITSFAMSMSGQFDLWISAIERVAKQSSRLPSRYKFVMINSSDIASVGNLVTAFMFENVAPFFHIHMISTWGHNTNNYYDHV